MKIKIAIAIVAADESSLEKKVQIFWSKRADIWEENGVGEHKAIWKGSNIDISIINRSIPADFPLLYVRRSEITHFSVKSLVHACI